MDRPTEVEIWKVVLPRGIEVNGTLVGDTKPTVYGVTVSHCSMGSQKNGHTRKGAKILEESDADFEALAGAAVFWRLTTG
jgi:hypothetical protein